MPRGPGLDHSRRTRHQARYFGVAVRPPESPPPFEYPELDTPPDDPDEDDELEEPDELDEDEEDESESLPLVAV